MDSLSLNQFAAKNNLCTSVVRILLELLISEEKTVTLEWERPFDSDMILPDDVCSRIIELARTKNNGNLIPLTTIAYALGIPFEVLSAVIIPSGDNTDNPAGQIQIIKLPDNSGYGVGYEYLDGICSLVNRNSVQKSSKEEKPDIKTEAEPDPGPAKENQPAKKNRAPRQKKEQPAKTAENVPSFVIRQFKPDEMIREEYVNTAMESCPVKYTAQIRKILFDLKAVNRNDLAFMSDHDVMCLFVKRFVTLSANPSQCMIIPREEFFKMNMKKIMVLEEEK